MQYNQNTQKRNFLFFQIFFIIFSGLLIFYFHPTEKGWWIFKYVSYPKEYFAAISFIVASFYMILITIWYKNLNNSFNCKAAIMSFFVCGGLSIILSLIVLYPLWHIFGFYELEQGFWIFKKTEVVAKNDFIWFFENTGVIAGPVEEFSKLIAVLSIPFIRKSITDRKSGILYVVMCAFGFAMIENIIYFVKSEEVLILRMNPAHAIFSAIWGATLGSWIAKEVSIIKLIGALLLGMGLHSLWNYSTELNEFIFLFVFCLVSWKGLFFLKKEFHKT